MAVSTGRRRRVRKSSIARALAPKLVRRARIRWKRRARKTRAVYKTVRQTPTKTWAGAKIIHGKIKAAPGRVKTTTSGAYQKARAKVTPNRDVTCSCGKTVPRSEVQAHLARHQKRHDAKQNQTAKKRAAAAKRMAHTGRAGATTPPARATTDPTTPSRREAGTHSAGWLAVGGVLVALPLDGIGSSWMCGLGAAGCVAAGAGAYASERRWGITNHINRESRRALRQQARAAGCNAACMTSALPKRTCKCPCGSATHGSARKGRAA